MQIDEFLFDLFFRREVLAEFEGQIRDLFDICKSKDEVDLLSHTLERMIVLSQTQYLQTLEKMILHIKTSIDDGTPLAIVAMSWGNSPDSSQLLAQMLKKDFRTNKNVKFFNSVPEYMKKNNPSDFPKFVLIDEFSGTGKTIESRLNSIMARGRESHTELCPHVCLLFGMKKAFSYVKNIVENTYFCHQTLAGISDYFSGNELTNKISIMKKIEESLAPTIGNIPMPSLGYGAAEALFFIKNQNAPNSNFPIFWWPQDYSGKDRNTLMERAEL